VRNGHGGFGSLHRLQANGQEETTFAQVQLSAGTAALLIWLDDDVVVRVSSQVPPRLVAPVNLHARTHRALDLAQGAVTRCHISECSDARLWLPPATCPARAAGL
jgi:hypothetical protein